jgi:SAM-dependent methyltransferase
MNDGQAISDVARRIEGESDDLPARLRRVARLALPVDARVVVVAPRPDGLVELNVPQSLAFPWTGGLPYLSSDEALIRELERLRAARIQFLLVPHTELSWLDEHGEFKRHLESSYRVVLDEEGTGIVFALTDPVDLPPDRIGSDGLPVPPPEMIRLVAGMFDWERIYEPFIAGGERATESIRTVLERNGLEIEHFDSILDFGCGCGRVIRQWKSLTETQLHGSDYNPYLIEWSKANLSFAEFTVNGVGPPLDYRDEQFDFLYALSIFTHFVEALQGPWANEVARVLRPGGFALVTLHGGGVLEALSEPDRMRFEAGELVVLDHEYAGTNRTAAYHPERYVRDVLAPQAGLEVVDYVPKGQPDMHQDAVLLRRT